MPSVVVADFKYGLDQRRPRAADAPGTLWTLNNALISRGGDIERSKKWVPTYVLPAGTFGLTNINGQLWVFGSANLAASMPAGVQYQQLNPASGANIVRVRKSNTFAGKLYVIAEYDDGNIVHWYNGAQLTVWDALSDANSSVTTLANYLGDKIDADNAVVAVAAGPVILITADVPGIAFTCTANIPASGTITLNTLQPNVAQVNETVATGTISISGGAVGPSGTNTLTSLLVNGVNIITTTLDFIIDTPSTANALSVLINNNTSVSGYQASVTGANVTISAAAGTGAAPNGFTVVPHTAGNFFAYAQPMAGGVAAVAPIAQITQATLGGVYASTDKYQITINGTAYTATGRASGYGTNAFVFRQREYFPAGSLLRYCGLGNAANFTPASPPAPSSDPGFLSVANDSDGNDILSALAPYQIYVAMFSRRNIRIYDLQADATQNLFKQPLQNTGTYAPNSVLSYGNTDVFYLDDTGIRSLQERDITAAAFVSDVGSPIDTIVQAWYTQVGETVASRAVSIIEPLDGRFMMAIGSQIFTLSYFPQAKVTAWSIQIPGFSVTEFTASKRKLYARDATNIYLYGGPSGTTYANAGELTTTVETSFISAKTLDHMKTWTEFNLMCQGTWIVNLLVDPDDNTKVINLGEISKSTFNLGKIGTIGDSAYVAVQLICNSAGAASISNISLRYRTDEDEHG